MYLSVKCDTTPSYNMISSFWERRNR